MITVPGHLLGLNRTWPPTPDVTQERHRPDRVLRSRAFLALVVAFALAACASYAVVVNLVPLLDQRGVTRRGGSGCPGSRRGRAGAGPARLRLAVARPGVFEPAPVLTLAGVAVTTALLAVFTGVTALITVAVLAGMVRGILTLVHATAVTDRWGASHYGQLSGVLSAPVTLVAAMAPWIGAALAALLGSYSAMFWVMAGLAAVAAVLGLASVPAGRVGSAEAVAAQPARWVVNAAVDVVADQPHPLSRAHCAVHPGARPRRKPCS